MCISEAVYLRFVYQYGCTYQFLHIKGPEYAIIYIQCLESWSVSILGCNYFMHFQFTGPWSFLVEGYYGYNCAKPTNVLAVVDNIQFILRA